MTRLHVVQHVEFEPPARIAERASERGATIGVTRVFAGEPFPSVETFDRLVVMGGPMGANDDAIHPWLTAEKRLIETALAAEKPVLGVCLGAQLLASVLGARVHRNPHKEIGWFDVTATPAGLLHPRFFLPETLCAFHWHGDTFDLPDGATNLARSAACENQMFVHGENTLGIQFHLEATSDTLGGMLQACAADVTPGPFVQTHGQMLEGRRHAAASHAVLDRILDAWL